MLSTVREITDALSDPLTLPSPQRGEGTSDSYFSNGAKSCIGKGEDPAWRGVSYRGTVTQTGAEQLFEKERADRKASAKRPA